MNNIYRIITLLLVISTAACVSSQSNVTAANDEDKDIGLGGTGMLANTGNGLGGTGIIGEITGYGSIFVNGVEVEYDNATAFTIDGKTAAPQQLEIGDVVEILTTDARQHAEAQVINLRHEVIGRVESVEPETYSFTVRGQTIVQAINKGKQPEVGEIIAVSGFRLDQQTILSTRISSADVEQSMLRTSTRLPFSDKAQRWLIQTHVRANKATIQHNDVAYTFALTEKTNKSFKDQLGIQILQLQKSATEKLELKQVIEQANIPRGRLTIKPVQQQNGSMLQRVSPGSVTNSNSGSGAGSGAAPNSGSTGNYSQQNRNQKGQ